MDIYSKESVKDILQRWIDRMLYDHQFLLILNDSEVRSFLGILYDDSHDMVLRLQDFEYTKSSIQEKLDALSK